MKFLIIILILLNPYDIFAQRVRLSGIPGQDSDMNITDMLDQIMASYHDEITNLNNKLIDEEIKMKLWREFKTNIENFDRINRYIYGYESAFSALTNRNSDPDALNVQTTRRAEPSDYRITINQLAKAHSLASAPISLDTVLSEGNFQVLSGTKTNMITFNGGNILALQNQLNTSLSEDINTKIINSSSNTKILSLISKKMGAEHKVSFEGDITPLLEAKLLTKGDILTTNLTWQGNPSNATVTNSSLQIDLSYPLDQETIVSFNSVLTPYTAPETNKISLGSLSQSPIGSIEDSLLSLPGAVPIMGEEETSEEPKIPIQEFIITFHDGSSLRTNLFPRNQEKISINLKEHQKKEILSFCVVSDNHILDISSLELMTLPDGSLRPYNETSPAQDAVILLDGLEVTRPFNSISDLLTGVTLDLLQEKRSNILVKITPDHELIKDTIIQWIMAYNTIMEEIYTFTTIPLEEIRNIKPLHQRLEDEEDLKEGAFYGHITLLSFRDRLRRMMASPHSRDPNSLSLLDQIGIYTKRRDSFSTDPDVLRKGTLSFDVDEFEIKLNEDFEAVHRLFVSDTNEDRVADQGVAVSSSESLKFMIGGNGYLTKLDQDNQRKMRNMNEKIEEKEEEVEETERKERQALLQMNQAIMQSKQLSESLQQRLQ